jgi:uncharacterized protein (TIRG00374 family)
MAVAIILLVLALRGADWHEILTTLERGDLVNLATAMAMLTTTLLLRALRWRLLLGMHARSLPVLTMFWALCAGYLGNAFLPARAGELIRTVLVAFKARLPKTYVFATVLLERVLDAFFLVLVALLALLFMPKVPAWINTASQTMLLVGVAGLVGLMLLPRMENRILGWLDRIQLSIGWVVRLRNLAEQISMGMRAFRDWRNIAGFTTLSVVIWLIDAIMLTQIAAAFAYGLTVPQALLMAAAIGLSSAIPSTPGYVGIYQYVAVTVMGPFGYTRDMALVFILAFQAVTYVIFLLWGLLGLWWLNVWTPAAPQTLSEAESEIAQHKDREISA